MPDEDKNDGAPGNGQASTNRTFSQSELDAIIADRLTRERSKYTDYDDLKAKAEQFEQAEAAKLSELERTTKALEEAQAKAAQLELDQLRNKAAAAAQLPEGFASRLVGKTEEELLADAKKLAEAMPAAPRQTPPAGRLQSGASPGGDADGSMSDWLRSRMGA